VEIIFFDLISKHKARNATICGLSGSKVREKVVLKNMWLLEYGRFVCQMPSPLVSIKCHISMKH